MLTCSQPLLEWTTCQRLATHPHIRFLETHEAVLLLPNPQKTRIVGVRVRERNPEAHALGKEEDLVADLVVDASGRGSRVLEWLEAQGFEQPAEITIDGKVGYATRYYRRPQQTFQADWKILALLNSWPQIRRGYHSAYRRKSLDRDRSGG